MRLRLPQAGARRSLPRPEGLSGRAAGARGLRDPQGLPLVRDFDRTTAADRSERRGPLPRGGALRERGVGRLDRLAPPARVRRHGPELGCAWAPARAASEAASKPGGHRHPRHASRAPDGRGRRALAAHRRRARRRPTGPGQPAKPALPRPPGAVVVRRARRRSHHRRAGRRAVRVLREPLAPLRSSRLLLPRAELLVPASGAAATLFAAYLSVQMGAHIGFGLVLLVSLFIASVLGFLVVPHLMVAAMIPLFALIPAAKLFVSPQIGPLKDLVALAAIVAAGIVALERRPGRRRVSLDNRVLLGVAFLLGLYVVNVGGGHGIAWAQGVRLTGEPLLLLLVGFTLVDPRRTLRYAVPSLVATACFEASYGLLQQLVGPWTLLGWGYSWSAQLRTYGGHLRSFGTMEDAFAYAAFLLFGLVAVVFWTRRGVLAAACGTLIVGGIAVAYVRTAALILVVNAGATQTSSYTSRSSSITLNGRTSAWKAALGSPGEWPFGRGVGKVGTAAQRATYTLTPGASAVPATRAVDSGYLATIADVGLAGAAVLLALLARLVALATGAIRRGRDAGWLGLGLLVVIMLDAVTRASFTGFPTAFLGLPLIRLALAAARQADRLAEEGPERRIRR